MSKWLLKVWYAVGYGLERLSEGIVWVFGASVTIAFLAVPPMFLGRLISKSFGKEMDWHIIDVFSSMSLGYFALMVLIVILAIAMFIAFVIYDAYIDEVRKFKQYLQIRKEKNDST